ncbi:MAG: WbqC family protein [bacterium]
MKKVIITQSNYIPWKGYFDSINIADEFILYDDMQYTKRDWRNRNQIKTKDGVKWLTVPVEVKGKYFQKINETKISDTGWGKEHWDSIVHNYSKAKYFQEYKSIFEELYLKNDEEYLSKVNYRFLKTVCEILGIKTKMRWSDEFNLLEEKTERLVDICKTTGATDYYSGPAAQAYMNVELFEKENISVHYFDYSGYPVYDQLHGEFTHAVSIIDLIFNEGPNATKFMKTF